MLSFIYTDSSENLDIYAKELFKAADQYQLDHLKGMSIFLENLSTSEILKGGEGQQCRFLKPNLEVCFLGLIFSKRKEIFFFLIFFEKLQMSNAKSKVIFFKKKVGLK